MIIDFFETDCFVTTLCNHFSLDELFFRDVLHSIDQVHESAIDIVKKMCINLCANTDELEIHCRHITTSNDKLSSIKAYGMLTLDQVLCQNTPLNTFLSKYNISINASKQEFTINNQSFHINGYYEPCTPCARGKTSESFSARSVPFYDCCDFHQKMALLNTKLYHDKSEVEVYVAGSDEEMLLHYTSILDGPEILLTIGDIISTLSKKIDPDYLQLAWSKQKDMKRYILEFNIPLNAIETNTDYKHYREYCDNSEWYEYYGFDYTDYENDRVPLEFYRNKMLIEFCFHSFFFPDNNCYCQVLPCFHISPEMISVLREIDINSDP